MLFSKSQIICRKCNILVINKKKCHIFSGIQYLHVCVGTDTGTHTCIFDRRKKQFSLPFFSIANFSRLLFKVNDLNFSGTSAQCHIRPSFSVLQLSVFYFYYGHGCLIMCKLKKIIRYKSLRLICFLFRMYFSTFFSEISIGDNLCAGVVYKSDGTISFSF